MGRRLRGPTIRRRSGEAKSEVPRLTAETGELLGRSVREARRLARAARAKARGRGAQAKPRAAARLEQPADRCQKVAEPVKRRVKREPIGDRIVSLSDPDARPIRNGKLGKPNESGYLTRAGRGGPRTPGAGHLGWSCRRRRRRATRTRTRNCPTPSPSWSGSGSARAAFDGGFQPGPTNSALAELAPERVFITGRQEPGSKRTRRRMQRYRTGAERRISHLKRRYGQDRSRLKGRESQQI
jgi:transposase, IS5 family